MAKLDGKIALVSGSGRGIGRAIAEKLASEGARLVINDIDPGLAAETVSALEAAGSAAASCVGDVTAADFGTRFVAAAVERFGAVDIVVNNAGLTRDGLALRMKDEDWQLVLDVNLTASFRLVRAALRGMMKRRWGRIVSIASVVGVTGNAGQVNYSAAKAGLIGMTKTLAAEVAARGITVNCVAPGFIETAMTQALGEAQREQLAARIPAGRLGSIDDVAAGVAFLVGDEASYITGQTLHVNGGMAMI